MLPGLEEKDMRVTEQENRQWVETSYQQQVCWISPIISLRLKSWFWSAHICWDYCAGKGHSFLQIVLTHRLLQAAHEDDVSWSVDTFLVAQLCWVLPGNPGWNPKANKFSSSLLWFMMQWNLPISNCNSKKEVNQLEKIQGSPVSLHVNVILHDILISKYEKYKVFEGKYRIELHQDLIFDRKSCVNYYWPYHKGRCW